VNQISFFYQSGHLYKEVCQLVSRVLTTYGHNETKWNGIVIEQHDKYLIIFIARLTKRVLDFMQILIIFDSSAVIEIQKVFW